MLEDPVNEQLRGFFGDEVPYARDQLQRHVVAVLFEAAELVGTDHAVLGTCEESRRRPRSLPSVSAGHRREQFAHEEWAVVLRARPGPVSLAQRVDEGV